MILVTGATGHLGKATAKHLLKAGGKDGFAVMARDPAKAADLAAEGVEVRQGDFDKPQDLGAAFDGIETLFFVSTASENRTEQQAAVVEAAVKAGIRNIVYTGVAMKDIPNAATGKEMMAHTHTEEAIRASGLGHTLLRNTVYADVIPDFAGPALLSQGIALPVGQGKAPFALRDELGEASAKLLLANRHEGKVLTLTSKTAWSFDDIAKALSKMTGKDLPYKDIAPSVLKEQLSSFGLHDFMIGLILGTLEDIRSGQYDQVSDDLETLLGRPPLDLNPLLKTVVPDLSAA